MDARQAERKRNLVETVKTKPYRLKALRQVLYHNPTS
jgi:hypothetical protein